jgi:hypothetical protein
LNSVSGFDCLLSERASVKVEIWKDTVEAVHVLVFFAEPLGFTCLNDMLVDKQFATHTDLKIKGN